MLGAEKLSLVEIEAFLAASESVRFAGCGRTAFIYPQFSERGDVDEGDAASR